MMKIMPQHSTSAAFTSVDEDRRPGTLDVAWAEEQFHARTTRATAPAYRPRLRRRASPPRAHVKWRAVGAAVLLAVVVGASAPSMSSPTDKLARVTHSHGTQRPADGPMATTLLHLCASSQPAERNDGGLFESPLFATAPASSCHGTLGLGQNVPTSTAVGNAAP